MEITMNIIWFVLVGIITALWATAILTPESRRYGSGGVFFLAILGALLGGLLLPTFGWFAIPLAFFGTMALSFLGSMFFLWVIGLLVVLMLPTKTPKSENTK